ncbi:hypothetical protein [Phenylobacterium sp.]|uniref:hypothetical protein n=1 Tax=Phenylobacterium sp. TaxID=1871053 RepID=UPI002F938C9A
MSSEILEQDRAAAPTTAPAREGRIRISLHHSTQLFSSIDPSPFVERNLDHAAERFIVNWAREQPRNRDLQLEIALLDEPDPDDACEREITEAVRLHFGRRADGRTRELRELLRRGRRSLLIGVVFLSVCLLAGDIAAERLAGRLGTVMKEGMTVAGWVAMWQPMNIFLYGWWPITGERQLFRRLSRMAVRLRITR